MIKEVEFHFVASNKIRRRQVLCICGRKPEACPHIQNPIGHIHRPAGCRRLHGLDSAPSSSDELISAFFPQSRLLHRLLSHRLLDILVAVQNSRDQSHFFLRPLGISVMNQRIPRLLSVSATSSTLHSPCRPRCYQISNGEVLRINTNYSHVTQTIQSIIWTVACLCRFPNARSSIVLIAFTIAHL